MKHICPKCGKDLTAAVNLLGTAVLTWHEAMHLRAEGKEVAILVMDDPSRHNI
jgi:transposase